MSSPPTPVTPPLLEASGIERRYDRSTVWSNLSLTVHPGEVVLVSGANGAGKSTLLRALAGLARPSKGTVRILGRDPYTDPQARIAMGHLGHTTSLYGDLTAQENLEFARALHGPTITPARLNEALDEAGLAARANHRVGRFSRGMAQRLALARTRLHDPALLLLDEPFTGLDQVSTTALQHTLLRHRNNQGAIVLVTHEPAEIWPYTTRVILLGGKKLLLDAARPATLEQFGTLCREALA